MGGVDVECVEGRSASLEMARDGGQSASLEVARGVGQKRHQCRVIHQASCLKELEKSAT